MKYYWKILMNSGKEYVVENEISDGNEFVRRVFENGYNQTISCHQLKGGGSVVVNSTYVSTIEINTKM
jgi:hypothetical protein